VKVVISVPGKIIITGEHAVVYGKPALAAAVDKRLTVTLTTYPELREAGSRYAMTKGKLVKKAVEIMQNYLGAKFPTNFNLEIISDIPRGACMGSSAALGVGIVTAFLVATSGNSKLDHRLINELAYKVDKFQHGNPSGVDTSTVTFGGFVWYRKEFEFLKSLFKFQFKVANSLQHFYLINTGKPKESTKEMVEKFKPNSVDDFEIVTKQITQAIHDEDEPSLMKGIKENGRLLEKAGMVSNSTASIIRSIEKSGGVAKISGGGGFKDKSGVLPVYHKNLNKLKQSIKKYGLEIMKANLGTEGVRIEKIVV